MISLQTEQILNHLVRVNREMGVFLLNIVTQAITVLQYFSSLVLCGIYFFLQEK